jgi:hypothetical protein
MKLARISTYLYFLKIENRLKFFSHSSLSHPQRLTTGPGFAPALTVALADFDRRVLAGGEEQLRARSGCKILG